jgi:S-adenosylmethionine synthetase
LTRDLLVVGGHQTPRHAQVEIIERKGVGHPDTLADHLAEALSRAYAKHTLAVCGVVLHHQFDKVGIMGGRARCRFGEGSINDPIRVLLNGRASQSFAGRDLQVRELLIDTCNRFFSERFPMLDIAQHLRILYEVNTGFSPGYAEGEPGSAKATLPYFFSPRSLSDLPERQMLRCNDTSLGVAFASMTPLEALVLGLEGFVNGLEFKRDKSWLGSDFKFMAHRAANQVSLTVAVPQIAAHVKSLAEYKENIALVRTAMLDYCRQATPEFEVTLTTNPRDNYDTLEIYLTVTGSCIESGDEGFVGRGNRYGGLIASGRPFTMEGISGKNPVYHTGKMYCVLADEIAKRLNWKLATDVEVLLLGQRGRLLSDPWKTIIKVEGVYPDFSTVRGCVDAVLDDAASYTDSILAGKYRLA